MTKLDPTLVLRVAIEPALGRTLLVQLNAPGELALPPGCVLLPSGVNTRFRAIEVAAGGAKQALGKLQAQSCVMAVEDATPVALPRAHAPWTAAAHNPSTARPKQAAPGKLCLGLVDSAIPFLHPMTQRNGRTKLLGYWNQNSNWGARGLSHQTPAAFGYGHELNPAQLDGLLQSSGQSAQPYWHTSSALHHRHTSHGAHTLSLLCGATLFSDRPGIQGPGVVPHDETSSADLVLVDLPDAVLQAVSSGATSRHLLDGVAYIATLAKNHGHTSAHVGVSYESWDQSHDGCDWFCKALDSLIATWGTKGLKLGVHVITGNMRDERATVVCDANSTQQVLDWQSPPGGELANWMEVWAPGDVTDLQVSVQAPDGSLWINNASFAQTPLAMLPTQQHPQLALAFGAGLASNGCTLRLAPTHAWEAGAVLSPHGCWKVTLTRKSKGSLKGVGAYIARARASSGFPKRSEQSWFSSLDTVKRGGTGLGAISGHACGSQLVAVAAHHHDSWPDPAKRLKPTEYSAMGPGRNARTPDVSVAVDDGPTLKGVLGAGMTAASMWRMQGTSAAGPLSARLAAGGYPPGVVRPALGQPILLDPYSAP